ncbi:SPIR1 protein, partial [Dromaius novaehollandiae]|nr:SPIR1 protein [Dromaius novaehollandiae]
MEPLQCEQRIPKVSLAEILRCFEHPISEEQAWALCFQCCCKMKQLAQGLHPLLHAVVIKGPGSIFIHADGAASFKVYQKSGKSTGSYCFLGLYPQLLEYLGVVIYEALDWGIDSQLERELSEPLEKLLSLMLKLDNEAMKLAVTLQDVIKVCEEHLSRPSEAASHYKVTCRSLFTEYMELQKLLSIIQTSKEVFWHQSLALSLLPPHATVWPDVIRELQNGVRLRKATERPQHRAAPKEYIRSPYELLVDDIQHKRYTLRKVIQSLLVSSLCLLALPSAMLCLQVLERKLKECMPQEPSWHEQLMAEIKRPQKLQPSTARENGSKPKGTRW